MPRTLTALLLTSALLMPAACTSSANNQGRSSSPAPSTKAATSRTPVVPITQPTSVPASPPNKIGVIRNRLVVITSCAAAARGWQAVGTAKGAKGKAATYRITVFFTTSAATVEAFGATRVHIPGGKTRRWTVTRNFAAVPGTRCLLRGAG